MTVTAASLEGAEVLRRIEAGETILCPSCRAELETIPKVVPPGTRPHGIACPRSQQHYLILLDNADAAAEIRQRLRQPKES